MTLAGGTTLIDMLSARAESAPDAGLVILPTRVWAAGEMRERALRTATGLSDLGLGAGDVCAIMATYSIDVLDHIFALSALGAVAAVFNTHLRGEPLAHQVSDSRAKLMVVDAGGLEMLRTSGIDVSDLKIVLVGDILEEVAGTENWVRHEKLLASSPLTAVGPARGSEPALILYTSGTTGLPKGCVTTIDGVRRGGSVIIEPLGLTADDVYLSTAPLYHSAGFMTLVSALLSGGSVAIEPQFSASRFMARAAEVGATVALGVGFLGMALLASPPSDADRAHRFRVCAFAPMPLEAQQAFEARFGCAVLGEMYGQTECAGPVSMSTVNGPRDPLSHGQVLPDIEVCAMGDDGEILAAGELGEIVVRPKASGAVFAGYWGNPEASLEKFSGLWLHTGDMGTVSEDGFLTFFDRKSDSVRRRGENVSAFQVERALLSVSQVAEAAVYGVKRSGEIDDVIYAVVVTTGEIDPHDLYESLATGLPYFAIPRLIERATSLPRNASGRVMKHLLKAERTPGVVLDLEQLGVGHWNKNKKRAGQ